MRARVPRAIHLGLILALLLTTMGWSLATAPAARAAGFTVTNLNNTGAGSLRQAVADAAVASGADTITFQSGLTGTITLTSTLTINQDVMITGPGAANLTIAGNLGTSRLFTVTGGTVGISGLTVTGTSGGGLVANGGSTVTLTDMIIKNSSVGYGGSGGAFAVTNGSSLTAISSIFTLNGASGILVNASILTLTNSTVSKNSTDFNGGGMRIQSNSTVTITGSTISDNAAAGAYGAMEITGGSTITIVGSTISGNRSGGLVGGINVDSSTLTMTNSTISGNTANTSAGGLNVDGTLANVALRFVTVTGNIADFDGDGSGDAGGIRRTNGVLSVLSSIVAGNLDKGGQKNDCVGTITSQGNNLFGAGTDCTAAATDSKVADINAVLSATLANNGGPTFTHALVAGSPAIGAGATTCTGGCPTTDQRGVARPQGARADIGAYEAEGALATPTLTRALTITTSGTGTTSVLPAPNAAGGRYNDGTQVTIAATAGSGQIFAGWTVDNTPGGNANPLTLTMSADHTVVANFSPLPPPPSFADVPVGYWAHDQIIRFAQRGITTGCDVGLYCPERPVTRAEMAVFLDRTLGFSTPPTPASQRFTDVPTNYWAYAFIDKFATLGITTGCGGTEFCPDRGVTRAEMAAFLIRALGETQLNPATPTFADVPASHPQYGYIETLVSLGVTTGCGEDTQGRKLYCPDRGVTRAEMAVFIIRAFP